MHPGVWAFGERLLLFWWKGENAAPHLVNLIQARSAPTRILQIDIEVAPRVQPTLPLGRGEVRRTRGAACKPRTPSGGRPS
eukprot:3065474-Alexandrium_andersonii.AAC.1